MAAFASQSDSTGVFRSSCLGSPVAGDDGAAVSGSRGANPTRAVFLNQSDSAGILRICSPVVSDSGAR